MTRWALLVVGRERTWPVELPTGRPTVVGRGRAANVDVDDPRVAERHLSLAVRAEGVVAEPLRQAGEALLNDVQLSGAAVLKAGDELRLGDTRLVVLEVPAAAPARPRVASHDELAARLEEELRRGGAHRPVGLALVAVPALNAPARQALTRRVADEVGKSGAVACWGDFTPDVLAAVVPELPGAALARVLARLAQVAGPRARVAAAVSPGDGLDGESLVEAALDRLLGAAPGDGEVVVEDAGMVRLWAVAEGLAARSGPVLAVGQPGSGRATLLSRVAGGGVGPGRVVQARDGEALEAALESARGGALLLRDVAALPKESVQAALGAAQGRGVRVLATAATAAHAGLFASTLEVPPLAVRRDEVLPLAEHFLARARSLTGRGRLVLGPEARQLVAGYRWPGNVRELKNVMMRAARAALHDEVGRDGLPAGMLAGAPAEGLRRALDVTERELLLDALARTRWNVTAAAARLGLPRRTVVYRMGRLGLRRPKR